MIRSNIEISSGKRGHETRDAETRKAVPYKHLQARSSLTQVNRRAGILWK